MPIPADHLEFRRTMVRRIVSAPDTHALLAIYQELDRLESEDPELAAGIAWLRDEALVELLPVFGRAYVLRLQQTAPGSSGDAPAAAGAESGAAGAESGAAGAMSLRPDEAFPMEFMLEDDCYAQVDLRGGRIRVAGHDVPQRLDEEAIPGLVAGLRQHLAAKKVRQHDSARSVVDLYEEDRAGFDAAFAQVEAELDGRRPVVGPEVEHEELRQLLGNLYRAQSEAEAHDVEEQLNALFEAEAEWQQAAWLPPLREVQRRTQAYLLLYDRARRALDERRDARACGVPLPVYLDLLQARDADRTARAFESFLEVGVRSMAPDASQRLASGGVAHDVHNEVRLKARLDAMLAELDAPPLVLPAGVRRTEGRRR